MQASGRAVATQTFADLGEHRRHVPIINRWLDGRVAREHVLSLANVPWPMAKLANFESMARSAPAHLKRSQVDPVHIKPRTNERLASMGMGIVHFINFVVPATLTSVSLAK